MIKLKTYSEIWIYNLIYCRKQSRGEKIGFKMALHESDLRDWFSRMSWPNAASARYLSKKSWQLLAATRHIYKWLGVAWLKPWESIRKPVDLLNESHMWCSGQKPKGELLLCASLESFKFGISRLQLLSYDYHLVFNLWMSCTLGLPMGCILEVHLTVWIRPHPVHRKLCTENCIKREWDGIRNLEINSIFVWN